MDGFALDNTRSRILVCEAMQQLPVVHEIEPCVPVGRELHGAEPQAFRPLVAEDTHTVLSGVRLVAALNRVTVHIRLSKRAANMDQPPNMRFLGVDVVDCNVGIFVDRVVSHWSVVLSVSRNETQTRRRWE